MPAVSRPLADAIHVVLLDAAPWWMKVTRAQRSRLEIVSILAAHAAEQVNAKERP